MIEIRKDEAEYELKKWYPNADPRIVKTRLGEYGELRVSLIKGKGTEFTIRPDGTVGKSAKGSKPSDTLLNALGKNVSAKYDDEIANINSRKRELEARDANFQIALQNEFERVSRIDEELRNVDQSRRRELDEKLTAARVEKERSESQRRQLEKERRGLESQRRDLENRRQELKQNEAISHYEAIRDQADRLTERIDELRNEILNADKNQEENIKFKIREELAELAMLEGWAEEVQDRISFRDKVKAIIKKYGFTVVAVLSAVGVIIGTIISNMKNALNKLGRGLGNGLKSVGKKLGEMLPGMIGAIASFIFKTAGEVTGFLGKHAWLW